MQIKKDDVKNRLLDAAEAEFLEKGFKSASVRSIVKNAETTIGNFYNYFESKEDIFSQIVKTAYNEIVLFIKNHQSTEPASIPIDQLDIGFLREYLYKLMEGLVPKFDEKFLLLVDCAKTTKYSGVKDNLIDFIGMHFLDHINEYSPDYKLSEMGPIISSQLIHGIALIVKNYKDEKIRRTLITEQLLFTTLGVMGILQGGRND